MQRFKIPASLMALVMTVWSQLALAAWGARVETRAGASQTAYERRNGQVVRQGSDSLYIHDLECNGTAFSCTGISDDRPYLKNINTYSASLTKTYAESTANPIVNPEGIAESFGLSVASASLADGKIHIGTDFGSTNATTTNLIASGQAFSSASAVWKDDVRFDFSNFNGNSAVINFTLNVHGDFGLNGFLNQTNFDFQVYNSFRMLSYAQVRYSGVNTSTAQGIERVFSNTGTWSQFGPEVFIGSFEVSRDRPDVSILMQLATQGGSANFLNTAGFSWILPSGVSYSSSSGTFLSSATSGVPEPETWSMLIAGFFVIGAIARSRRFRLPKPVECGSRPDANGPSRFSRVKIK